MAVDESPDNPNPSWRRVRYGPPDPQAIEEDPEVGNDPLIRKLRALLDSGEPLSFLLKGRED